MRALLFALAAIAAGALGVPRGDPVGADALWDWAGEEGGSDLASSHDYLRRARWVVPLGYPRTAASTLPISTVEPRCASSNR